MKLNKQSNIYTIIYILVLVTLVGTVLAVTSMALKDKQEENINADKMRQILASVHIASTDADVAAIYQRTIVDELVVNSKGEIIGDDAFDVDVQKQSKIKDVEKRLLPVFVCKLENGELKYILPAYGNGLWGPIWGYIALDANGSTVYGAYFAHQGETPGLGAEIEKPAFSKQFDGKNLFKNDKFLPIAVLKKGLKPTNGEDYVDAVSGGTITSKGVGAMLSGCLKPYEAFLKKLNTSEK